MSEWAQSLPLHAAAEGRARDARLEALTVLFLAVGFLAAAALLVNLRSLTLPWNTREGFRLSAKFIAASRSYKKAGVL